jgi:hypothetical protein
MKKQVATIAGVTLLAMMLCGSALAQNDIRNRLRSDVPVDFVAGDTALPAGVYTFVVDPVEHRVRVIQDSTTKSVFLDGMPADPSGNGGDEVTLQQVNGTYHLTGIAGRSFGVELPAEGAAGAKLKVVTQAADGRTQGGA